MNKRTLINVVFVQIILILVLGSFLIPGGITGKAVENKLTETSLDLFIGPIAEKNNVPLGMLKGIAFAESGFNTLAVTDCGAAGIVKLMPGTAKALGLKVYEDENYGKCGDANYLKSNPNEQKRCFGCDDKYAQRLLSLVSEKSEGELKGFDDRFDAEKSLDAAAKKLAGLRRVFANLPELAIAAFNLGGERVKKACCAGTDCKPLVECLKNIQTGNPDELMKYVNTVCSVYGSCKEKTADVVVDDTPLDKIGVYRFRPSFRTTIDYSFDDYSYISEVMKGIIVECEDPRNVDEKCFERTLQKNFSLPYVATLNYCESFSREELKCLLNNKLPTYVSQVVAGCKSCSSLDCSDIKVEKICMKGSQMCSDMDCEWYGASCEDAPSDEKDDNGVTEEQCVEGNYKGSSNNRVPVYAGLIGRGYDSCKKCSDVVMSCLDYPNEKYCGMDPCSFGCVKRFDDYGYVDCRGCPEQVTCEVYPTESECYNANCGRDCIWEDDKCRGKLADEEVKVYPKERTFDVCVVNTQSRLPYTENNEIWTKPAAYRFVVSLRGKPPAPVEGLRAVQLNHTDSSVLLSWDKSHEFFLDYYYVYAYKTPDVDLTEDPFFVISADRHSIDPDEQIDSYDFINISEIEYDPTFAKHILTESFVEVIYLEPNKTFESLIDDKIYLNLDGLDTDSSYKFYVAAVNIEGDYLTDLSYYEDGGPMVEVDVKDKLSPGPISNLEFKYNSQLNKYDIEFDLYDANGDGVPDNEDGSVMNLDEEMTLLFYFMSDGQLPVVFDKQYFSIHNLGFRPMGIQVLPQFVDGTHVKIDPIDFRALGKLYSEKLGEGLGAYLTYSAMFVLADKDSRSVGEEFNIGGELAFNPAPSFDNNYLTLWGDLVPAAEHYSLLDVKQGEYKVYEE